MCILVIQDISHLCDLRSMHCSNIAYTFILHTYTYYQANLYDPHREILSAHQFKTSNQANTVHIHSYTDNCKKSHEAFLRYVIKICDIDMYTNFLYKDYLAKLMAISTPVIIVPQQCSIKVKKIYRAAKALCVA